MLEALSTVLPRVTVTPPLTISDAEIARAVEILRAALNDLA